MHYERSVADFSKALDSTPLTDALDWAYISHETLTTWSFAAAYIADFDSSSTWQQCFCIDIIEGDSQRPY